MEVDRKFTYINEQSDPGGQAPFSSPHQAQARRPGCSFLFPRSKPPAWLSCQGREVEKAGMNPIPHPLLIPQPTISN